MLWLLRRTSMAQTPGSVQDWYGAPDRYVNQLKSKVVTKYTLWECIFVFLTSRLTVSAPAEPQAECVRPNFQPCQSNFQPCQPCQPEADKAENSAERLKVRPEGFTLFSKQYNHPIEWVTEHEQFIGSPSPSMKLTVRSDDVMSAAIHNLNKGSRSCFLLLLA
jgi:hypothetical protein